MCSGQSWGRLGGLSTKAGRCGQRGCLIRYRAICSFYRVRPMPGVQISCWRAPDGECVCRGACLLCCGLRRRRELSDGFSVAVRSDEIRRSWPTSSSSQGLPQSLCVSFQICVLFLIACSQPQSPSFMVYGIKTTTDMSLQLQCADTAPHPRASRQITDQPSRPFRSRWPNSQLSLTLINE